MKSVILALVLSAVAMCDVASAGLIRHRVRWRGCCYRSVTVECKDGCVTRTVKRGNCCNNSCNTCNTK